MLNLFNKKTQNYFTLNPSTTSLAKRNDNFLSTRLENEKKETRGITRHYPPVTKEWSNSVYTYNKNFTKSLPTANSVVSDLLKSYFNLSTLFKNKKSSRVQVRFKRLSLNRIMVSKAEMKHTNNKVIITVYLYNRNKKFLFNKLNSIYKTFLFKKKNQIAKKSVSNKSTDNSYLNQYDTLNEKRSNLGTPKAKRNGLSLSGYFTGKDLGTTKESFSKFSTKRPKSQNKKQNIRIKTNFYANFTKLTKNSLTKFISSIQEISLKNKYKTLITNAYSELNKFKFFTNGGKYYLNLVNLSENGKNNDNVNIYASNFYKLINNNSDSSALKTRRTNNYSNLINKSRKARNIKNIMFKLRKFYKLFFLSDTYNYNVTNSGIKNGFLLGNLYRLLKTSLASRAQKKINSISLKGLKILKKARKHKSFLVRTLKWNKRTFANYEAKYYKNFVRKSYRKEILYLYYTKMLSLNNNKFKNWFLLGLKQIISKIYNKNVEFNFVNLKYMHLNSDIFAESIAIKLRNRENRLLRVLKKALRLVKLPSINKLSFYDARDKKTNLDRSKSISINSFFPPTKDKDILHGLLEGAYSTTNNSSTLSRDSYLLKKSILDSIKYKTVYGVRLEAAGRLSRRLTASRSVFKLKYKGSLKNIDSSYKGLSSVMLRGVAKPNVQFTKLDSKTRNGSFGLKGWVSGS